MYLLNTAGILHENPYTGDRIVKARLLDFSHTHLAADNAPLQTLRQEQAQQQGPEQPQKVYLRHRATVAIKYLQDSAKRSYGDSDSEQEDQGNSEEDQTLPQIRSPEDPVSSAHASWLARLRLLSKKRTSPLDQQVCHNQQSKEHDEEEESPLAQAQARQPESIRFGIKARRELLALQAAQGHRHVITLLGWTGAPVKREDLPSAPSAKQPEEKDTSRSLELENPALLDIARPTNLMAGALLPLPLQGRADATTSDPGAMSLETPSSLFGMPAASLGPGYSLRRFSDSEDDDGSFLGESDLEDEDEVGEQDSPAWSMSVANERVLDLQDLKQYYKAQPRIGGLLLPYMPLTLRDLIQSGWSKTRPRLVMTCMEQIVEGLDWIHEEAQLIHRDISAGNILVSTQGWMNWTMLAMEEGKEDGRHDGGDDQRVFCVISDFGCATKDRHLDQRPSLAAKSGDRGKGDEPEVTDQQQQSKSSCLYTFEVGTRNYRAPELLFSSQTYGKSVDMWSAGVLFAELFLGSTLFDADTDIGLICAIVKVLGSPSVDNWPEFPEMPDYGKLNFQSREVTPLSTLLLGDSDQDLVPHEGKKTPPPPTRATKLAVEIISKLVIYAGKQRLSAREVLDRLRSIESRPTLSSTVATSTASAATPQVDDAADNDYVDILAIQHTLQEQRRRHREEDEDDGGGFGFSFGFGGGSRDTDEYGDDSDLDGSYGYYTKDDGDDGDRWVTGETAEKMPRYRHHRRPFVSQTGWLSDEEY
ncbi:Cyclin-dependent kinase 20 [Actinomortierella ambigua]|nr:Cyclin-dependent kinase 20 [Actinomortierella ambigua]